MIERSRRVATACVERERGLQSSCRGCWLEGVMKGAEQGAKYNRKTVLIFKKQATKEQTQNCRRRKQEWLWQMNRKSAAKKSKEAERGSHRWIFECGLVTATALTCSRSMSPTAVVVAISFKTTFSSIIVTALQVQKHPSRSEILYQLCNS